MTHTYTSITHIYPYANSSDIYAHKFNEKFGLLYLIKLAGEGAARGGWAGTGRPLEAPLMECGENFNARCVFEWVEKRSS
jgi:hypothetical protein